MSHRQSMDDQTLLLSESRFSSTLKLEQPSGRSTSNIDLSRVSLPEDERKPVVLSTQSEAARKQGTQQLIPKNLAVSSRTKNHHRHHTTVVTLPVPDVSWDDYDSDGSDGFSLRRNRRNQSYRAAVTSLNLDAFEDKVDLLAPVSEEKPSPVSTKQPKKSASKRTLGRIRNRKQTGSFKDDPRFYQDIKERGLNNNLSTEEDEFSPTEPPDPDQGIVVKNYRASYITWSQLQPVKEMGILDIITPEERKRQEAIFEIITSEYSYQHSLSILVRHFKDNAELKKTMNATEHHHLFSNISVILEVSKRFFEELESRHHNHPFIEDISDIMQSHAVQHFRPYIVYCSNETFQQRTLQKLLISNNAFRETLKRIESSEECGGLPMISFLILPMQRVTRLPLLMDTICQKTPKETPAYTDGCLALKAISKLVKSCNDGARRMERTEQMYTIQKQMEFGKIKPFPLVSSSRWLKKSGELALFTEDLSIFKKAFSYRSYYLFLFNDVLIVTKKKSEESYVVLDYATVKNVSVEEETSDSKFSLKLLMSPNSDGRSDRMTLVAESRLDRARWITALSDLKQNNHKTNDGDLPQYEATKAYMPKSPDELSLQQAELVIVLQEVDDWCHGERMRDGERGWFPANCASQITNRTAMECNIKRMERLRKETNV